MEWRCVQCGRPHRTNNPPCDACGSHDFERAVVQVTKRCTECGTAAGKHEDICPECGFQSFEPVDAGPTAGELDSSYEQWVCPECGKEYPRNSPPCDRCGSMRLEREQVGDIDPKDYVEMHDGGGDGLGFGELETRTLIAVLLVLAVIAAFAFGVI